MSAPLALPIPPGDLIAIKIKLADEALITQRNLALAVATTLGKRVYVYDKHNFFSQQPFDIVIVNSIRTVSKDGKTAVLSVAAQNSVPDACTYRALIPPFKISEDDTGVYVTA